MADARPIELFNLGTAGIVRDLPDHTLPPEVWSDGNNIRFQDGNAFKFKGDAQVFGTPTVAPGFGLNVPSSSQNYWIYCSLTKAYVYEGGVHTNITRQTAGVDVNYTATDYRLWNGGILGGIPILNNGLDVPQYWSSLSPSTKLADLVNWPANLRAKVVRPFGPFLIALNCTVAGTAYPHLIRWSHPADPGAVPSSWDITDPTKDAGQVELTDIEGGSIQDALMLRNLLVVYKEASTHTLRFIGGQNKMKPDLLFASSGILAPRCVTQIDRGTRHFVATVDDVVAHDAQNITSIVDKRMRKYIQNDIDATNYVNSFCVHNPAQREAWFCYPASGAVTPNKALIWNYNYNTLQIRDLAAIYGSSGTVQTSTSLAWSALTGTWETVLDPWTTEGKRQMLLFDATGTKIYQADSGESFHGTNFTSFIERTGLAVIGRDRQGNPKVNFSNRKLLKRIWPKITGSSLVSVRCGAQEYRNSPITWETAKVFNPATMKYLDFTANGRLLCVRFESSDGLPWQLEGYDLEIEVLGDH